MHPHTATKSSLELLQLERLLRREPHGLNPAQQEEAMHYFSKTEEYLEGESMLLQKLRYAWPLVEDCFIRERGLAEPRQPVATGDPSGKALNALREIQHNLAIAEGRQAATEL